MAAPMKAGDMSEKQLNAAFEAALKQTQSTPAKDGMGVSAEEAEKLKDAFSKPEFRKMFQEYVDEISDPAHRAEYEQYLSQLEKDDKVPEDMSLIRPKAGFCIKGTETTEARKVFINVCHAEELDKPSVTATPQGQNWSVPNTMGPPRMEKDNKGVQCITFDVAFHPDALHRAAASKPFQKMICSVAMEGVAARWSKHAGKEVKIDEKYHILKKVACMGGTPATMSVRKGAKEGAAATGGSGGGGRAKGKARKAAKAAAAAGATSATSSGTTPAAGAAAARAAAAAPAAPAPAAPAKAASPSVSGSSGAVTPLEDGREIPAFSVVHRGQFDMSAYMEGPDEGTRVRAAARPKELVVKIVLSKLKSAKTVDLDVAPTTLKLSSPGVYALDLKLPYEVDDLRGAAKFDKSAKTLVVTLPVKPPPAAPKLPPAVDSSHEAAGEAAAAKAKAKAAAAAGAKGDEAESKKEAEAGDEADAAGAGAGTGAARTVQRPSEHSRWVSKEAESSQSKEDIARLKEAAEAAKRKAVADAEARKAAADEMRARAKVEAEARAKAVLERAANRDAGIDDVEAEGVAAAPNAVDAAEETVEPRITWRQNARAVTVLVHVAKVDADSVTFKATSDVVDISFRASGHAYRLAFVPGGKINAAGCRHDIAGKNMVCVLAKPEGTGTWPDLRAAESPDSVPLVLAEDFVAAKAWAGSRPGYVFKTDSRGLGYYRDGHKSKASAKSAAPSAPAAAKPKVAAAAAAAPPAAKKTAPKKASPKKASGTGAASGAGGDEDDVLEIGADGAFELPDADAPVRSAAKVNVTASRTKSGSKDTSAPKPHPLTGAQPVAGGSGKAAAAGGAGTTSAPVEFSNTLIHELD